MDIFHFSSPCNYLFTEPFILPFDLIFYFATKVAIVWSDVLKALKIELCAEINK